METGTPQRQVIDLYLTEKNFKILAVKKKTTRVMRSKIWYVIHPPQYDPRLVEIKRLEDKVKKLKKAVSSVSEAKKAYIASLPREQVLENMRKAREARLINRTDPTNEPNFVIG